MSAAPQRARIDDSRFGPPSKMMGTDYQMLSQAGRSGIAAPQWAQSSEGSSGSYLAYRSDHRTCLKSLRFLMKSLLCSEREIRASCGLVPAKCDDYSIISSVRSRID